MRNSRLATIAVSAFSLAGCAQENAIELLLVDAFMGFSDVRVTDSCTGFFGLGTAVASFDVSLVSKSQEDLERFLAELPDWSLHDSVEEFVANRSETSSGIEATLLDGKDCLERLSPNAEEILLQRSPGAYYASKNGKVVLVLFSEGQGSGVIFLRTLMSG